MVLSAVAFIVNTALYEIFAYLNQPSRDRILKYKDSVFVFTFLANRMEYEEK
jgi:hypothetical protein